MGSSAKKSKRHYADSSKQIKKYIGEDTLIKGIDFFMRKEYIKKCFFCTHILYLMDKTIIIMNAK